MNYTDLLIETEDKGLVVKEIPLTSYDGRIKNRNVAIRKDIGTTVQKKCVLAEELGHYETTSGDILSQCNISDMKQESRARGWAYDKLIGLTGIISAYKHGCTSLHDMAEFLEVTEEFLSEALERYKGKYGCYAALDNYIIYFEPSLGVLEMI